MTWGESGSGTNLTLNYGAMCNDLCKCNGQLGYCMNYKKLDYMVSRCKVGCDNWFPNSPINRALCKGYCYLLGEGNINQLPTSLGDYLSRFVTEANPFQYHKAPPVGSIPAGLGVNGSWPEWRSTVFRNNTGCVPQGDGLNYSPSGLGTNILGQTTPQQSESCNKWSDYTSKYIDGIYQGTVVPLTVGQLYSYSNPYRPPLIQNFENAKRFCENLTYLNGDIVPPNERPFCCGGNGPNISNYNPKTAAMNKIQPELMEIKSRVTDALSKAAKQIQAIWVIALMLIIVFLIIRFL